MSNTADCTASMANRLAIKPVCTVAHAKWMT